MGSFTGLLVFSAALYLRGAAAAEQQPDYRQADAAAERRLTTGEEADAVANEAMETALLRGGSSS